MGVGHGSWVWVNVVGKKRKEKNDKEKKLLKKKK